MLENKVLAAGEPQVKHCASIYKWVTLHRGQPPGHDLQVALDPQLDIFEPQSKLWMEGIPGMKVGKTVQFTFKKCS